MHRRISLAAVLSATAVSAIVFTGSDAAAFDKYAAEFLRIGVGARALGMGGAFVAIADDASAAQWNPAGLALLRQGELMAMHSEHLGSLASHDYLGFAQPLQGDKASGIGIGLVRFSVDDIPLTKHAFDDLNGDGERQDNEPILTDRFEMKSDDEYGLFLTYAREVRTGWLFGGNVKMLRQGLLDNTSFGIGLDFGVLYLAQPGLVLGARLSDATATQISWDTGHKDTVSPSLHLGGSWSRGFDAIRGSLTAAGGVGMTFDRRIEASQFGESSLTGDLQGGLEYWYAERIAARVGTDAGELAAGAGLRLDRFGVDYAFLSNADLDDSHRISANVRF